VNVRLWSDLQVVPSLIIRPEFFTPMVACFGLIEDCHHTRVPPERFTDSHPCVSAPVLCREPG
jgi:hypothetical protein